MGPLGEEWNNESKSLDISYQCNFKLELRIVRKTERNNERSMFLRYNYKITAPPYVIKL